MRCWWVACDGFHTLFLQNDIRICKYIIIKSLLIVYEDLDKINHSLKILAQIVDAEYYIQTIILFILADIGMWWESGALHTPQTRGRADALKPFWFFVDITNYYFFVMNSFTKWNFVETTIL